jgi:hypothetical protein
MSAELLDLWKSVGRMAPGTYPDGDPIDGSTGEYIPSGALIEHPADADGEPCILFDAGDHDAGAEVAHAVAKLWNMIPDLLEARAMCARIVALTGEDIGACDPSTEIGIGLLWRRAEMAVTACLLESNDETTPTR